MKRLPAMWRPGFDPWVGKISWRRKWHPTPVFLPGESHGQRSLVGYSPWGLKELDTTEWLHFHFHIHTLTMYTVYIKMHHQRHLLIRKNTTCSTRTPVPSVTSEMMGCGEERGSVPGEEPGSLASQGGWEQCLFINTNWQGSISLFSQLDGV